MTQGPFDRDMARLALQLRRGLPGVPALLAMAPAGRGFLTIEAARAAGCREAAALAALYPVEGVAHLALTVRRADLPEHAGQVSLPGGRCRPGEPALACAVREAWEELALPPDRLAVLGPLTPVYIPPSAHCVQPYLASLPERPVFRPDPGEVAELIEVPLDALIDPACRRRETWQLGGEAREVPFFAFGGPPVWGATAMMLAELAALWAPVRAAERADAAG
jgi:8-oxo-dGTP pyrophosphatase MutT (NUDIX family)